MVFVDLRKAYDSVTRKCMWEILRKAGVPDKLVTIISSFHASMSANLSIPDIEAEPIEVQNGLRQGCCMAPALFNIFMWAVFQLWQREVADIPEIGLPVSSNSGPSLLFKRQKTDTINIHRDCQFADDSALIATTHHGATLALSRFMDVATRFGLTINLSKTKVIAVGFGISPEDHRPLVVGGEIVENVHDFRYLGSIIHTGGRTAVDTRSRIASASRAFGALRRSVFDDGDLSLATKRMVYDACVASLLLYGAVLGATEKRACGAVRLPSSLHFHNLSPRKKRHLGLPHQQEYHSGGLESSRSGGYYHTCSSPPSGVAGPSSQDGRR